MVLKMLTYKLFIGQFCKSNIFVPQIMIHPHHDKQTHVRYAKYRENLERILDR